MLRCRTAIPRTLGEALKHRAEQELLAQAAPLLPSVRSTLPIAWNNKASSGQVCD